MNRFILDYLDLKKARRSCGFTIVELLVVIVIIAILVTITFVSYTGIVKKATAASLISDLNTASTKMKLFQAENNAYPVSITDCPVPASGNICIGLSAGNSIDIYTVNNTKTPNPLI
jgi:prepilin-type N-terminal cleavage/methylation domain-containing protein